MTRVIRAIRFPFAFLSVSLFALIGPAHADSIPGVATPDQTVDSATAPAADIAAQVSQALGDAEPVVEKPTHRLYCVEYARIRSGLQIFGDARLWWERAHNLYARIAEPVSEAVMVFSGSARIRKGHVAVVTAILGPREIKVDHANWQNHGEIDLNMPVLDVSEKNDWSRVRVWDPKTNAFGARIYAISGFITRMAPAVTAAN